MPTRRPAGSAKRERAEARLLAGLEGPLREAWLECLDELRETLSDEEIVRAIEFGRADSLITPAKLDEALGPVRVRVAYTSSRGFEQILDTYGAGEAVSFGHLNPRVVDALRTLEDKILKPMGDEVRETVRQHVTAGIVKGNHPKTTARTVRDVIGLAPNQEEAVRNFQDALERGDTRKALSYKLRDRRYDAQIKAAGKLPKTRGPVVDTYHTFRGVSKTKTPNDYGAAGKGRYSSGSRRVAESYAGKGGEVFELRVELRRPLKLSYSELDALQMSLFDGQTVTGFDPELSRKFDAYLRGKGYDGVVLFDREISATVPQEVVELFGSGGRGGLAPEQIDKMVQAYRRKRVAEHAGTVSRTATLNAYRTGQHTAALSAIDAGVIDRARATKTWRTVRDSRVRDEHRAMEGETVPIDQPFSNGEMYPIAYGCRCRIEYGEAPVTPAAARVAA